MLCLCGFALYSCWVPLIHGYTWLCMGLQGKTCEYIAISGCAWWYMVIHGYTREYMGIHGYK